MIMLWKEKKELVLLINPNRKKFLTVNSFDNKKVKRKTNSFFFLQKTPQNSLSNTLFNLFFNSREEKQNKKPVKKKCFFFQQLIFFCFFLTIKIIFSIVEIFVIFFQSSKLFFQ